MSIGKVKKHLEKHYYCVKIKHSYGWSSEWLPPSGIPTWFKFKTSYIIYLLLSPLQIKNFCRIQIAHYSHSYKQPKVSAKYIFLDQHGEVSEWFKEHAWKACVV